MNINVITVKLLAILSLTGFMFSSLALHAETKDKSVKSVVMIDAKDKTDGKVKETFGSLSKTKFIYNPPMRGAPAVRIGGGTRGLGLETIELVVLAPDHTGLTITEQPRLYWYVSKPVISKLEVTLINDESNEPVYEDLVANTTSAGIQSIDLAKAGIKLKQGLEYRWYVSVVADKKQRSNDIVASGTIKYVNPESSLTRDLLSVNMVTRANIFTQKGIWYDAIDTLMIQNEKSANKGFTEQHIALLEQVGLQSVADYMRKHNQ